MLFEEVLFEPRYKEGKSMSWIPEKADGVQEQNPKGRTLLGEEASGTARSRGWGQRSNGIADRVGLLGFCDLLSFSSEFGRPTGAPPRSSWRKDEMAAKGTVSADRLWPSAPWGSVWAAERPLLSLCLSRAVQTWSPKQGGWALHGHRDELCSIQSFL